MKCAGPIHHECGFFFLKKDENRRGLQFLKKHIILKPEEIKMHLSLVSFICTLLYRLYRFTDGKYIQGHTRKEYLMVKVRLKTKCFIPVENICHSTIVLCFIISW